MRKHRDVRIVTLEQDYKINGAIVGELSGNPMKKGSQHAMHVDLVEQLKKQGVKMKVEKPDFEKLHADIKARRREQMPARAYA